MNKEITPEIRNAIAALYWDVECFKYNNIPEHTYRVGTEQQVCEIEDHGYLLLKTISSITDEDAMGLCVIANDNIVSVEQGKRISQNIYGAIAPFYIPDCIDFLRSKGYATPAFGYSVEQLEKAGVFKLI